MTLRGEAILAVLAVRTAKQTELDQAVATARAAHLTALRAALRDVVPADHPLRPVAELVAASVTVGRESDNFPARDLAPGVRAIVCAAYHADRSGKRMPSVIVILSPDSTAHDAYQADYDAWAAARAYREAQTPLE